MQKKIFIIIVLTVVSFKISAQTGLNEIDSLISSGGFSAAAGRIDSVVCTDDITVDLKAALLFRKEVLDRIKKDFRKSREDVKKALLKYYPGLTEEMIDNWESDGSLEMKVIDGEKRYFNNAVPNLFRINKTAKERKIEVDGAGEDGLDLLLRSHLPVSLQASLNAPAAVNPQKMIIKYTLTVKPGTVPEGEIIRVWLPFPKGGYERQSGIKLISVNDDDYIISPDSYIHKSIYIEKPSSGRGPTAFQVTYEYSSASQWFNLAGKELIPYDTSSSLYKQYTAEEPPHIVFTEKMKTLSREIVRGETDIYRKIQKIAVWINDNIPWASAREYSTIDNISDYCITNMHGDCGIKSLLFITLARYNGIPAKWQSGWMMHPPALNLHDWTEVYIEGLGWVPVDPDFGIRESDDERIKFFYTNGIDSYRMIVNDGISGGFFPAKVFPRSETVDFQRGEVEWRGGNLYFDKWSYDMDVEYADK